MDASAATASALASAGTQETSKLERPHLPALDGLRAIAVLWVMIFHYEVGAWGWWGPVGRLGWAVVAQGWLGVDLFFALSGFLITGILWDTREQEGYYKKFYARRTLRIFPLYYAYLAVVFIVLPAFGLLAHTPLVKELPFWTYTGNIPIGLHGFESSPRLTPHFWSLAIEEQFYLVWPAVVRALGLRGLMKLCLGCVAASLALRTAVAIDQGLWHTAPMLTPLRLDGLTLGAFGALALRTPGGDALVRRIAPRAFAAAAALSLSIMLLRGPVNQEDAVVGTVGLTVYSATFAAFVTWMAVSSPKEWLHRLLTTPLLRSIGRVSYGMYVLHFPVRHVMFACGWSIPELGNKFERFALGQLVFVSANVLGTYAAAWLSYQLLEQPLLRLKRHFAY